MTLQEKRNYLEEYKFLETEIKSSEEIIKKNRSRGEFVSQCAADMTYNNETHSDKVQNSVAEIDAKERQLYADILLAVKTSAKIEKAIAEIDNKKYRLILTLRYLVGEPVEKVAEILDYTPRYVFELSNRAIKKLNL